MNVYEFEKSLLVRLEESANVLNCKNGPVPASEVRSEWAYHVELQIEPAGWQALWKISRVLCEELNIKYPTVVWGTVTNIFFRDLKAEFTVSAVQDDDVHIPEFHVVPIEDLWPTKNQENPELNIERTADCIDQLRFFYRNVWMPWDEDNDEDLDWFEKHLESRIRFCFDLKRGMSRAMADHVRVLLTEARYIQSRRELIESEMSDSDEEDVNDTSKLDKSRVTTLMRLHLRLAIIRNEVELLENPEMRQMYKEINFPAKETDQEQHSKTAPQIYVISRVGNLSDHVKYMNAAKKYISDDKTVQIVSTLQECLKMCSPSHQIYIPNGCHEIKSLELLNSNGSIKAILDVQKTPQKDEITAENGSNSVIVSEEDNSTLLVFNGDYTLENITFDCRNVRTGLWIRSGCVTVKNCDFLGDHRSSTGNGIIVSNGAAIHMENSSLKNFASGISCGLGSKATLTNCAIASCRVGLEFNDKSTLEATNLKIVQARLYAVIFKGTDLDTLKDAERFICATFEDLKNVLSGNNKMSRFSGDCEFKSNQKGNILVLREEMSHTLQSSEFVEDSVEMENVSPASRYSNGKIENTENELVNNNLCFTTDAAFNTNSFNSEKDDSFLSSKDTNDSVIIVD